MPSLSPFVANIPSLEKNFLSNMDKGFYNRVPSDDAIKMKFVKLWDLLRYSERTTSKTPTRQKLAIRGKLSLSY